MAKQPDVVGLFTGISNKPIDPTNMTLQQRRLAMQDRLLSSAKENILGAFGKETSQQKLQKERANYLNNFDNLPVEEQKKAIYSLQAAGQTALAGQLASRLKVNQNKQEATKQKPAIKKIVTGALGEDFGEAVDSGLINKDNYLEMIKKFKSENKRFLASGGNIFDTQQEKWLMKPKTSDLIKVGNNLYDPSTKQFIQAPVNQQETDNMTEYKFLQQQNADLGIATPRFEEWIKGSKKPTTPTPSAQLYYEAKADHELNSDEPFPFTLASWVDRNQKAETTTKDFMDEVTGITHSYLINTQTGERIQNLGISKLPKWEIKPNSDGTYYLYNELTQERSQNYSTVESIAIKQKEFNRTMGALAKLDNTMGIVGEARELSEGMGTVRSLSYDLFKSVPLTSERELAAKISTIQSNLAFDKLEDIRNNSPTGGALGQVSNIELGFLRDAVTALDPALGVEAFNEQLKKIEVHYNRFKASVLGQSDYRIVKGRIYIKDPEGTIHDAGSAGGLE